MATIRIATKHNLWHTCVESTDTKGQQLSRFMPLITSTTTIGGIVRFRYVGEFLMKLLISRQMMNKYYIDDRSIAIENRYHCMKYSRSLVMRVSIAWPFPKMRVRFNWILFPHLAICLPLEELVPVMVINVSFSGGWPSFCLTEMTIMIKINNPCIGLPFEVLVCRVDGSVIAQ